MTCTPDRLKHLSARLNAFATERDWDQFHNPKNLAMALAGEVGELLEHFQWLTLEQAANLPAATRDEVALDGPSALEFGRNELEFHGAAAFAKRELFRREIIAQGAFRAEKVQFVSRRSADQFC